MSDEIVCPECGSTKVVKAGTKLTRTGRKQRYQCNNCARKFIQRRKLPEMEASKRKVRK